MRKPNFETVTKNDYKREQKVIHWTDEKTEKDRMRKEGEREKS